MDIKKSAAEIIKRTDTDQFGSSLLRKARIFAWESGLEPVINALPNVFGQQAVLYFPGRSEKYSFPCCEHEGRILLAVTEKELEEIRNQLLQSPGVEIWLKSGWFVGTVRLLSAEEKSEVLDAVTDVQFYGNLRSELQRQELKDHSLLEVTRNAPCTGKNGPGSKAWVWPLAAVLLLVSKKK